MIKYLKTYSIKYIKSVSVHCFKWKTCFSILCQYLSNSLYLQFFNSSNFSTTILSLITFFSVSMFNLHVDVLENLQLLIYCFSIRIIILSTLCIFLLANFPKRIACLLNLINLIPFKFNCKEGGVVFHVHHNHSLL